MTKPKLTLTVENVVVQTALSKHRDDNIPVDVFRCEQLAQKYLHDIPVIDVVDYDSSVEDIDKKVGEVTAWLKALGSRTISEPMTDVERLCTITLLVNRLQQLHLDVQQLLYRTGFVERGDFNNGETTVL